MKKLLKTGPVVIELRDFSTKSPWSLWQWKLEPFLTEKNLSPHITVNFNLSENPVTTSVLYEEKTGFYKRRVYSCNNNKVLHTLENKDKTIIAFSKDGNNISLVADETNSDLQAPFEFLSRTVIHSLLDENILTFHGVLIEHEGEAIIISAPSETGKTTHAHFWRDNKNAIILNGDNACCYKENEWKAFSVLWSGTSGECVNRCVSVKALVILKQGSENIARRLTQFDAFSDAFSGVQCPSWNKIKVEKAVDLLDDFIKTVPVFLFECRNEKEAADVLEKALEEIK